MPANTGQFGALLYPGLKKVFVKYGETYKPEWKNFLKAGTTKQKYEKFHSVGQISAGSVKKEGEPTAFVEIQDGFDKTLTTVGYSLGFAVTHEMYMDDQYGVIERMTRSLRSAMETKKEYVAASILDGAFDTFTTMDAQYLCSTTHVTEDGVSWSNRSAAAADLDTTALRAARQHFAGLKTSAGYPMYRRPSKLIVSENNYETAVELLKSSLEPGTANNTINTNAELGWKIVVSHYLTDTDAWFVMAEDTEDEMLLLQREPLFFQKGNAPSPLIFWYYAYERYSAGPISPYPIYGVPGS